MSIRFAAASDCAAMLAIYAPYIETTITFEQEVPSQQEFAARVETVQQEYPWIVWEEDGKILGYAYAHKFAERISYRPSAELSVYLDRAARGRGIEVIIAGADKAAKATRELIKVHNAAEAIEAPQEQANAYANEVIPAMDALRAEIDALECVVERDYWPVPTYNDILFYA